MNKTSQASNKIEKLDRTILWTGVALVGVGLLQSCFIFTNRHLDELALNKSTRLTAELYNRTYNLLHDLMFGLMPWIAVSCLFSGLLILYCIIRRSSLDKNDKSDNQVTHSGT
jgi:hypothetical protein